MKIIIFIFILLVIFMLVRSMGIEMKEYFNEEQCKRLSNEEFGKYIQQKVMNDLGRSEEKNSMVTYKIGDPKSFYKLKKSGEYYINEPFDSEVSDQIDSYLNISKGQIIVPACKKGFLGSNCNSSINLFDCEFNRNENKIDLEGTQMASFPKYMFDPEIGGILGSIIGQFLLMLFGKKFKKEIGESFGKFKYGKTYPVTNKDGKIENISYYQTYIFLGYYKHVLEKEKQKLNKEENEQTKNEKKIEKMKKKIARYEKSIENMEGLLKKVKEKFDEDGEQNSISINDYIEDYDEQNIQAYRPIIRNTLFNGFYSKLKYECRDSVESLAKENPNLLLISKIFNCIDIKPKGDDKLYSLKFVLVEDTDNPPHNAGNIQAYEIDKSLI